MKRSVGDWLLLVSKHWPFINPATVWDLPVQWWAYYVRGAQEIDRAAREAQAEARRAGRNRTRV